MKYPEAFEKIECPVEKTVALIGNKWSLLILRELNLAKGPLRFNELSKPLQINSKTLSVRLKELTDYGIIEKAIFPEIPPRTEYTLTEKGEELNKVFWEMAKWSQKWHD